MRETVSHHKPKKLPFAKECVMNVLAPLALPPTPVIWKIRTVLKLFGKLAVLWKNPDIFEIVRKIDKQLEKSGHF